MRDQPMKGGVCGAKLRGRAETCRKAPLAGRTRCRLHGGASLIGVESRTYRHGRYSKALPPDMATRYRASRRDPALLTLRDEIALLDARTTGLLTDGDARWADILATIDLRRRLVVSEARRTRDLSLFIPVGEAMNLVGAVTAAVRAHVSNPAEISAIQQTVRTLLERRTTPA